MARGIAHDLEWRRPPALEYLAALLHGRRARLAEAERLDPLCLLRTLPELARAACPGADYRAAAELQRRVVHDLVVELSFAAGCLVEAGRELLAAMQARYQVENLKVVLRAFLNHLPLERVERNLLFVPEALGLDLPELLEAGTLEKLASLVPLDAPRSALQSALRRSSAPPRLFFLEAALDRGYLEDLLEKAGQLGADDRAVVRPIVEQEACAFQLMLVVRGRFLHGLAPETLLPLHLRSSGLSRARFRAMSAAPDVRASAIPALGRAIDILPAGSEPGETSPAAGIARLESMAWTRHLRLSIRAFRRSHMGLGAIVGYFGIRRVEVQNLITLSEGVRGGVAMESIRARLIPRAVLEVARV